MGLFGPKRGVLCSRCRGETTRQISESGFSQKIADLELENRRLKGALDDAKAELSYFRNMDLVPQPQFEGLSFQVGKMSVEASRIFRNGPVVVNERGKAHLARCMYADPRLYPKNRQVNVLDLGQYKLARCCCSPEALDILESGNLAAYEEFQRNIGW